MASLRLALKQSLEESSGGYSPPSLGSENNQNASSHNNSNAAPQSPGGSSHRVSSPTGSTGVPQSSSSTFSNNGNHHHHHNSNSPQQWKKRGPGRPRKSQHYIEGGTGKKRGRPRKHTASGDHPDHAQHEHEEGSSSENEFSGEENEEIEEEQSGDTTEQPKDLKSLKRKKHGGGVLPGPPLKEAQSEPSDGTDLKASFSSNSGDRKEVAIPSTQEEIANGTTTTIRNKELEDGRLTKGAKTVPPPDPRVLAWTRNLPVKEARLHVKQGIRVKVRFATKAKKEGKRKKKWYGGLVSQVSKAGSKIRIKYDDGTSEVARFPDMEIVVDAAFNGEHQCATDFFDPPPDDGMSREDEESARVIDQPNESADVNPMATTTTTTTTTASSSERSASNANTAVTSSSSSDVKLSTDVPDEQPSETSIIAYPETGRFVKNTEDVVDASKEEHELSKPAKRKRGRPPKRSHPSLEVSASSEEPAAEPNSDRDHVEYPPLPQPHVPQSPTPTEASSDLLVQTPVHQPNNVGSMDVDDAELSMPVNNDQDVKPTISIRIPKLKVPSEVSHGSSSKPSSARPDKHHVPPPPSGETKDNATAAGKRIHIQLTGSGSKSAIAKDSAEDSHPTKGRTTPMPIATNQKDHESESRTPLSPRSKKAKRKRVEPSPGQNRSRSPRTIPNDSADKFASEGSAFEKSSSLRNNLGHAQIEEDKAALVPKGRPGKVDAARSGRRVATKEPNEHIPVKQEEHPVSKKKKKRDRRREAEGDDSDNEEVQQQAPWVQCDHCKKWRIIPSEAVGSLPDRWFCKDNVWDPKRASCEAPQQKDKQLVRERKRRKRQRLMEKAAAAAENRSTADAQVDVISDESNEQETSATSRSHEEVGEGIKRPRRASPTENSDSSVNNDHAKGDKKSHPKKPRGQLVADESLEVHEDDGTVDLKPRGRGRPRRCHLVKESTATAHTEQIPEQTPDEADNLEWVQCEKCDKWRKLPPHISADELPEVWYCAMNTWNPASASCSAPEDKVEAGLTDIFSNGGGKLSYRNLIFGNGRKFNRPISERTRAAESLFAAVSEDADVPPAVMYANSGAFISRSKLNQPEESDGLSILELMSRSNLWKELHALAAQTNGGLFTFDNLPRETKESLKDLILQSLGSRTLTGEEVANDIQHRNWQQVPLGWAAAQPHCTVNTIVMTMCELVKEGVLECMKGFMNGGNSGPFVLRYRRAKSYSQATLKHVPSPSCGIDCDGDAGHRCMKFAKPWKSTDATE